MVFVYLGRGRRRGSPSFDFVAGDGERHVRILGFSNCNWLQCVENGMDPLHVGFTHGAVWSDLDVEPETGGSRRPTGGWSTRRCGRARGRAPTTTASTTCSCPVSASVVASSAT